MSRRRPREADLPTWILEPFGPMLEPQRHEDAMDAWRRRHDVTHTQFDAFTYGVHWLTTEHRIGERWHTPIETREAMRRAEAAVRRVIPEDHPRDIDSWRAPLLRELGIEPSRAGEKPPRLLRRSWGV